MKIQKQPFELFCTRVSFSFSDPNPGSVARVAEKLRISANGWLGKVPGEVFHPSLRLHVPRLAALPRLSRTFVTTPKGK
jgi:hypothetical protein